MAPPSSGKKTTRAPSPKKKKPRTWPKRLMVWALIGCAWCAVIGIVALLYFAHDLPDISKLEAPEKKPSIVIRSLDGQILANYGDLYGDYLGYNQLPKHLVDALLATEDRRFFEHFGIDPMGLARAAYRNYTAGRVVEGGSTITQQLAKNLFLSPERTLTRKIQEAMLALALEHKFTKEQIVTLYLNRVYLGSGTFGVDAAAKRYFGKSAPQLSLTESAMIIGLLKAPSRFSPTNNPDKARARAQQVMENMREAGFIKAGEEKKAAPPPAKVVAYREGSMGSYYFADWLMEHLDEYVGRVDDDIEIITTLDANLQKEAEEVLEAMVKEEGPKGNFSQAALISMSPDGAIRAMVGGTNYRESQFNRVTQARRQPGSSFKLFPYLAALERGGNPNDIWVDEPIAIGKWKPDNYGHKFYGQVTMAEAFAQSLNTVAVQVSEWAGRGAVVEMARRLGITTPMMATPSVALGSFEVSMLELAGAYSHLANQGRSVYPYGVEEIRTSSGTSLYKRVPEARARVLSSHTVMGMNSMLMGVVTSGTGRNALLGGYQVAGKTGTSQEYRDAWFTGFTSHLLTSVWVGNDSGAYMKKITGGSVPAKLWKQFMQRAHKAPLPDYMKNTGVIPADDEPLLPWQTAPAEELPWLEREGGAPAPAAPSDAPNADPSYYDPSAPVAPIPQSAPNTGAPAPSSDEAFPQLVPVETPTRSEEPGRPAVLIAPPSGEARSFDDIINTPISPPQP